MNCEDDPSDIWNVRHDSTWEVGKIGLSAGSNRGTGKGFGITCAARLFTQPTCEVSLVVS